jgi:hypothetical protein
MKQIFIVLLVLCSPLLVLSQDIRGLWTGTMYNDSTKESLHYEIFITKDKGKWTGFSETWFTVNNKQCFGIKKLKIHIAKDGKIVMQDGELLTHNFPVMPDKNVDQLNVLDLFTLDNDVVMSGPFATQRTKNYGALTGRINVKKVTATNESSLITYLYNNGNDVTTAQ